MEKFFENIENKELVFFNTKRGIDIIYHDLFRYSYKNTKNGVRYFRCTMKSCNCAENLENADTSPPF